jgi:hypothetical protein
VRVRVRVRGRGRGRGRLNVEEGEWVRASACAGGRSVTTLVCPGPPGRQAKVDWVHGARLE